MNQQASLQEASILFASKKKKRKQNRHKTDEFKTITTKPEKSAAETQPIKRFFIRNNDKFSPFSITAIKASLITAISSDLAGLLTPLISQQAPPTELMILLGGSCLASILSIASYFNLSIMNSTFQPGNIQSTNHWPDNTKILASSSQWSRSQSNQSHGLFYTKALMAEIKKTNSIEEAHNQLREEGYPHPLKTQQKPVSRPDKLGGWNKKDTTTINRMAIIIGGGEEELKDLNLIQNTLKNEFKLKERDIRKINVGETPINLELLNISGFIDSYREEGIKSEILIYYIGHGYAKSLYSESNQFKKEGDAKFYMLPDKYYTPVSENVLRAGIKKYLNLADTVHVIIDSCASGAAV